jgi:hypothetical protein
MPAPASLPDCRSRTCCAKHRPGALSPPAHMFHVEHRSAAKPTARQNPAHVKHQPAKTPLAKNPAHVKTAHRNTCSPPPRAKLPLAPNPARPAPTALPDCRFVACVLAAQSTGPVHCLRPRTRSTWNPNPPPNPPRAKTPLAKTPAHVKHRAPKRLRTTPPRAKPRAPRAGRPAAVLPLACALRKASARCIASACAHVPHETPTRRQTHRAIFSQVHREKFIERLAI